MACGGIHQRGVAAVAAFVAVLALGACGSSKKEDPAKMPVTGPGAPVGAPDPETAIRDFFTAKREGDTERGCALESEDFQRAQYGSPGQACLNNLANKQPQKVWRETIKIDKLDKAPDSAAAKIRPNSGSNTPAEVTLVRGKGGWLIHSLR